MKNFVSESVREFIQNPVSSMVVPDYRFDKRTRDLIQVGEIDLQAQIDSCIGSTFDAILDKYLDTGEVPAGTGSIVDSMRDDLADLVETSEYFEEVRERYHFRPDMPVSEMIDKVHNELEKLNANIKESSKGGQKNEKTPQPQAPVEAQKQETVPEHRPQDAQ